jgi:IclR family KDG regulon transcriptional repressor
MVHMVEGVADSIRCVVRVFQIMECLSEGESELDLGEIAQKTKLSKSTVFRFLATMQQCGYIRQNPQNQKYGLGFNCFHLGAAVLADMSLRNVALPYMKKLCDMTSETTCLNIVSGNERVCIEMLESSERTRSIVYIGERSHLCIGASGKCLLVFLPETDRQRIIQDAMEMNILPKPLSVFLEEISKIQQLGYALTEDNKNKDAFSISAPIFDYTGKLVGSIAAVGPRQRLTAERVPQLIVQVCTCARKISRMMGYSS